MQKDFDRLVARASDPNLIPGIYNYCDRRCPRCAFNERCLSFLDSRDVEAESRGESDDVALAETIERSLQRTIEFIRAVAGREGVELSPGTLPDDAPDAPPPERNDPLARAAYEYATITQRIVQALEPIIALRDDADLTEAVDAMAWFSTLIGPKICRAIAGQASGWDDPDEIQSDANGSAKVARLGIAESRRAWSVLMEAGKATADGVPARAVQMLDDLDRQLAERFPRAMAFVRPGFDEPAVAAGALTDLPPFAPRQTR